MKTVGKIIAIPRGQYNATTTYAPLDMVFLENNSWVCKKEVTGVSPSDEATEYWYRYTDVPSGGSGMTEEQAAQLTKNTEDISKLSREIENCGLNATAKNLLITILKSAYFSTDQTSNINALEITLASGGEDNEQPTNGITQSGSVLAITSGVTASQSGSTLTIS